MNRRVGTALLMACRMGFLLAALSISLTGCNPVPPGEDSDIDAVRAFHAKVLELGTAGVPRQDAIDALGPFISERFRQRLLAARAAEDAERARHGGTEPPLLQGSLFHSLFEGAHRIISVEKEPNPDSFLVTLEYGYEDAPETGKTTWQDRTWLTTERGLRVVEDLEYLGQWEFGTKGRLSVILENVGRDFFPQQDL
jgi:hypothetical protein